MCLLDEIKALGIQYETRMSDLYLPYNETNKALIKKHNVFATTFISQIDNKMWYDVFGANSDYWKDKTK